MRRSSKLRFVGFFAFLSACSLGPEYTRPQLDLPEKFQETAPSDSTIANLPWWELFADVELQVLIRHALAENKDLAVAAARIDEARATLGVVRADQFPSIDLAAHASRRDLSSEVINFDLATRNDFGLFGDLSFEVDLWGRLRRATEAERALLLSTEYAYRAITIQLVADVARLYFTLLDLDERSRITRNTLKTRRDSTGIIRSRFKHGVIPELDVNQAEIEEAEAATELPAIERELRSTENALSVLLGRAPYTIKRNTTLTAQKLPDALPSSFPASLLERRPDLMAAEERVKSAVARVGVAQAERLPTISITGFIGLQSNQDSDLFTSNARTWGVSGGLLGPILDFGKRRNAVEAAEARVNQELKSYEGAVLRAVQEVEDSLVAIRTYREQHQTVVLRRKAATNSARLSRARYNDGQAPYLEVLDSERSLYNSELNASFYLQNYLNSIVQLYKALGGGWSEPNQK